MSSRSSGKPVLGGSSRSSEVAALGVPALVLALAVIGPVRSTSPMRDEPLMMLAVEPVLRVCADPNNLPFSNRQGQGFENKIAALLAHSLDERLVYAWWPERRGFVGHTVDAGICDVVIGVPSGYPQLLTTRPYYRSTYVFVSRADRALHLRSLDDARLHQLRIGLHFTGGRSNPPPADALAHAVYAILDQGGIALINHPNFDWALSQDDVVAADRQCSGDLEAARGDHDDRPIGEPQETVRDPDQRDELRRVR